MQALWGHGSLFSWRALSLKEECKVVMTILGVGPWKEMRNSEEVLMKSKLTKQLINKFKR